MTSRRLLGSRGLLSAAVCAALSGMGLAQPGVAPAETARVSRDFAVGQDVWTLTDLDIHPAERVVFAATGRGRCDGVTGNFGPEGLARGFRDLLRVLPMAQTGRGTLLGRIGAPEAAQPFVIGSAFDIVVPAGGVLSLGINRTQGDACSAAFSVHVEVFPPKDGAVTTVASRVEGLPGADQALFAKLPRRISDRQGNPGDMVNFLILGSDAGMKRVFSSAGWVTVDPDVRGALIAGAISSLSKEAYLTLPMSQLYLYNRPQDYGWAHAEPIKVIASRHHLRVWRAPYQVNGTTLWVGAATHDIGFDRDRRNNGITHKIDPDIDLERTYVEQTLTATGVVAAFTYVLPANPLLEAQTATGASFHSDGRVLVLELVNAEAGASPSPPSVVR